MKTVFAASGSLAAAKRYSGCDGCLFGGSRTSGRRNSLFAGSGKRRRNVALVALGDEYKILSVTPGASEDEVRKAYRRLALKYHPDCSGENTANQFRRINEAYKILVEALRDERERPAHTVYESNYHNSGDPDEEPFEWSRQSSYYDDIEEWMGWEGAGIGFRNDESVYTVSP